MWVVKKQAIEGKANGINAVGGVSLRHHTS
jgi:hypothetical protein